MGTTIGDIQGDTRSLDYSTNLALAKESVLPFVAAECHSE